MDVGKSCIWDEKPHADEARIFREIQQMIHVSHPDSHPCRVKLWLLVGEVQLRWEWFDFFFSQSQFVVLFVFLFLLFI